MSAFTAISKAKKLKEALEAKKVDISSGALPSEELIGPKATDFEQTKQQLKFAEDNFKPVPKQFGELDMEKSKELQKFVKSWAIKNNIKSKAPLGIPYLKQAKAKGDWNTIYEVMKLHHEDKIGSVSPSTLKFLKGEEDAQTMVMSVDEYISKITSLASDPDAVLPSTDMVNQSILDIIADSKAFGGSNVMPKIIKGLTDKEYKDFSAEALAYKELGVKEIPVAYVNENVDQAIDAIEEFISKQAKAKSMATSFGAPVDRPETPDAIPEAYQKKFGERARAAHLMDVASSDMTIEGRLKAAETVYRNLQGDFSDQGALGFRNYVDEETFNSLDDLEKIAINYYTLNGDRLFNEWLRARAFDIDPSTQPIVNISWKRGWRDEHFEEGAQVLDAALDKLPNYRSPSPDTGGEFDVGVTWRVVAGDREELNKIASFYKTGEVVEEPAYMSTSRVRAPKKRARILYVVTGKNGKPIEQMSSFSDEAEVLYKRRSRFKVLNVSGDFDEGYRIELEEVTSE
jgi:hypothetical protein